MRYEVTLGSKVKGKPDKVVSHLIYNIKVTDFGGKGIRFWQTIGLGR